MCPVSSYLLLVFLILALVLNGCSPEQSPLTESTDSEPRPAKIVFLTQNGVSLQHLSGNS